jgi:hypothetical protein
MKKLLLGGALCAMLSTGAAVASCQDRWDIDLHTKLTEVCKKDISFVADNTTMEAFKETWRRSNSDCKSFVTPPSPTKVQYDKRCEDFK